LGPRGMVGDRAMALVGWRRDPRCKLALYARWHHADKQEAHSHGADRRRAREPSVDREAGHTSWSAYRLWLGCYACLSSRIDRHISCFMWRNRAILGSKHDAVPAQVKSTPNFD